MQIDGYLFASRLIKMSDSNNISYSMEQFQRKATVESNTLKSQSQSKVFSG